MDTAKLWLLLISAALLHVYGEAATCHLGDIKAASSSNSVGLPDASSDATDLWKIKIQVTNICNYCDAKDVKVQVLSYDSSSICQVPVGDPVLINSGKSISPGQEVAQDYYQSSAVVSVYHCLSVKSSKFVNCRD